MGKSIQILVIDDHQVVREGLWHLLGQEKDFDFIGQGADSEEALFQIEILSPDIVITDIKMPGMDGIELTREIKARRPSCNVIVLTLYDEYLTQALAAGARGYLLKDTKREELAQAIRRVHRGQVVISEGIKDKVKAQLGYEAGGEPEEGSRSQSGSTETLIEEVQLVLPPPVEANQLMRFTSQVEEMLQSRLTQVVGSWNEGTAMTVVLADAIPLPELLNKLEGVPEIEDIEENPTNGKSNPKLLKKANAIPRLKDTPRKTFFVTLEKDRAEISN